MILYDLALLFLSFGLIKAKSLTGIDSEVENQGVTTNVDLLIDALKRKSWDEQEIPCYDAVLLTLENAKNFTLWAVWALDSLRYPTGQMYGAQTHLSNYDQCMKPELGFRSVSDSKVKTKYCLTKVALSPTQKKYSYLDSNVSAETYLETYSKMGRDLTKMYWGVCVPQTCVDSAVAKFVRAIIQISHLSPFSHKAAISVDHCEDPDDPPPDKTGMYIFNTVFVVLIATAIFCTYYVRNKRIAQHNSFEYELAKSFCLKRNMESLTNSYDDEVYVVNIMRIITASINVSTHYIHFMVLLLPFNGLEDANLLESSPDISTHIDILVDTFFALSGLLFTRGLLNSKSINPLKHIWRRYIRLIGVCAVVFFYTVTMIHHIDGPFRQMYAVSEQETCIKYGWTNFLMINNYFNSSKWCLPYTWSVPCDFHFCILATIIFCIYKWHKTLGLYVFWMVFVGGMVITSFIFWWYDLPNLMFYGVNNMVPQENIVLTTVYTKSYTRSGPFMVGMMAGYLLHKYNPADYRKVITKTISYATVIVALVVMYVAMSAGYYVASNPVGRAIQVAADRSLWGFGVCLVIIASEYGYMPMLNRAFSWSPLVPLSRLTYGVYVLHFMFIQRIFFSVRTNVKLDPFVSSINVLGVVTASFFVSLLSWLLFEAPLININSLLMNYRFQKDKELTVMKNDVSLTTTSERLEVKEKTAKNE